MQNNTTNSQKYSKIHRCMKNTEKYTDIQLFSASKRRPVECYDSNNSSPPTRQEFKLFLEGGWCDVVIKESLSKEVKDEAVGSVNDTKAGTLMFVRSQISAFESLLVRGNLDDSSFLGTETSNGKWVNITLDSFLDAATDDTDFQRGNYEESWRFLLNFYTSGQMID
eukprot:GEMP01059552.1.p1 GENE.GEMP01059552.1~~GEMP01059552.1.p1  ORF type:complete len:167 (+),score=23.08 GEMP01059552.1:510-1010(+)